MDQDLIRRFVNHMASPAPSSPRRNYAGIRAPMVNIGLLGQVYSKELLPLNMLPLY